MGKFTQKNHSPKVSRNRDTKDVLPQLLFISQNLSCFLDTKTYIKIEIESQNNEDNAVFLSNTY